MLCPWVHAQDVIREMEVIDDPSSVVQNRVGSNNARRDLVKEIGLFALFEDFSPLSTVRGGLPSREPPACCDGGAS